MSMGLPPTDPAPTTPRPSSAGAPARLPAGEAIAVLRELDETDPETLGRLAYQMLTGVEAAPEGPVAPAALVPGFPPFASEVLMRAIAGPEERRPTTKTLLIVLETVPAATWPQVTTAAAAEPAALAMVAEPDEQPSASLAPSAPADAPADDLADPLTGPADPTPVTPDRGGHNEAFRDLLRPSAEVPKFDPLTAPWDADSDGPVLDGPVLDEPAPEQPAPDEPARSEASGPAAAGAVTPSAAAPAAQSPASPARPLSSRLADARQRAEEEPRGMHEEFRGLVAVPDAEASVPEPAGPEPDGMHAEFRGLVAVDTDRSTTPPEPVTLPVRATPGRRDQDAGADPAVHPSVAAAVQRDLHDEFRGLVAPPRPVPHIDPIDDGDKLPDPGIRRRRSSSSRKRSVTTYDDESDRRSVLIMVAIVLALVVLGIVYATTRGSSDDGGAGDGRSPDGQGASLSISHSAG